MPRSRPDGTPTPASQRAGRRLVGGPAHAVLLALFGGAVAGAVGSREGFLVCLPVVLVVAAVQAAIGRRIVREREALRRVALSDPLTGLANRRLLHSHTEHEIARHARSEREFVVVMLDLDGFKALNDRFGHAAGDEMLRDVADSLTRSLRAQDTVARLGGDEFCVVAPETARPRELAERILAAVADATTVYTGLRASAGASVFPRDGDTTEELLRAADQRLLLAKRARPSHSSQRAA